MTAQANLQLNTVLSATYVISANIGSPDQVCFMESRRFVHEGQRQVEAGEDIVSRLDAAAGSSELAEAAHRHFGNAAMNYGAAERVLKAALEHRLSPGKRSFIETKLEYITARRQAILASARSISAKLN